MTGTPREALERIRESIRAESVSYGELSELSGLVAHIEPGDVELLEWAGVPEFGWGRKRQEAAYNRQTRGGKR